MSGSEISVGQVTRFFLGIYLPLAWLYEAPAVLRFASISDFAAFVVVSIAATCVLAPACWFLMVACARLLRLVLPIRLREMAGIEVFAAFLSILAGVAAVAWLADHGLPLRRTLAIPVICLTCIAVTALRPALVAKAVAEVIENGWQLMRIPIYALSVAGVVFIVAALAKGKPTQVVRPPASPTIHHPSIVLITIDAFSATRSNLYGAAEDTTPFIKEFAQQATVFDMDIAATNFTASSFATLHTGQYPWTHHVLQHQGYFRSQPATIAASLHLAGYRSAYFDANWFADPRHTRSPAGWSLAVGPYDAVPIPRARTLCALPVCDTSRLATVSPIAELVAVYGFAIRRLGLLERVHYPPDPVLADARSWISENSSAGPLFVWIHLFPPHDPYFPPAPFLYSLLPQRTLDTVDQLMTQPLHFFAPWDTSRIHDLEARYKESLRYVDDRLGRFLHDPAMADFLSHSIVVITSDHGESFERNFVGHTGPLLTQSLVHVPLIVRTPDMHAMRRIGTPVSETDVMPTIVDLAGVAIPPSVDGISLKPLLEGTPAATRIVYAMNFENATAHSPLAQQRHSVALIDWPWKYIEYEKVPQLSSELYDLAHDPSETSNLASAQPQLAQHYSTLVSRSIAASDARERK